MMQNSGPTGSSKPAGEPRLEFLPGPVVHADLATAPAFAASNGDRSAARVEIGPGEGERFADTQPGAPEHDDQAPEPLSVDRIAGGAHDRDDLLDGGRISRVAHTFCCAASVPCGTRAWWPASGDNQRHRASATSCPPSDPLLN